MKQIETEIVINASPKMVWKVLTGFENHPAWNPFIISISGSKLVGDKLTVRMQPPNGSAMTFKPNILVFEEEKEFRWIGKFLVKGIFDGEHYFQLIDIGNNQTKLIHGEQFGGILIRMMGKVLEKTKIGFELMNKALKDECEKQTL